MAGSLLLLPALHRREKQHKHVHAIKLSSARHSKMEPCRGVGLQALKCSKRSKLLPPPGVRCVNVGLNLSIQIVPCHLAL